MILASILVVGVPLLIFFAIFWIALKHRLSMLGPFLIVLMLSMGSLGLAGLNPLGFFVSPGGWLLFAGLCWLTALFVRGIFYELGNRSGNN